MDIVTQPCEEAEIAELSFVQVSAEDGALGKVAKYALDNAQRPLVLTRAFQPIPVSSDAPIQAS